MGHRNSLVAVPMALGLPSLQPSVQAATVNSTWVGNAPGDGISWNDADNWTPVQIPNNGIDVFDVTINNDTVNATGTFTVDNLSISGQILNILATPGINSTLTVANGFINPNAGRINLDSTGNGSANLKVTAGTLDNRGTLNIKFGTGSQKTRTLNADMTNSSTVDIEAGGTIVDFNKTGGGTYTNNSTFNIGTGSSLKFNGSQTFNQGGGALDNQGSFTMGTGDTFNFNGGALSGNDLVLGSGSTLNIGVGSTGAGVFSMQGTTTYSGDIAAAQTVTVQGVPNVSATMTAANGFINNGTLNLDSTGNGSANLKVTAGTLDNRGSLNIKFGTGSAKNRTLNADMTNNSTVDIEAGGTIVDFNKAGGGTYTNNSTFNIGGSGSSLKFNGSQTFNQDGGALDNQGSFTMGAGDTFNFNGGALSGNDLVLGSGSTLNIGVGSTGAGSVSMQGATTYSGDIAVAQTVTIQGVPGVSATMTAANGFINNGTLTLDSSGNGSANLTVTTGTVDNQAALNFKFGTGSSHSRTLDANLANAGTLNVEAGTSVSFNKASGTYSNTGTFTINDNATVTIGGGGGAARTFTNEVGGLLQGTGTLNVGTATFMNDGTVGPGLSPGEFTFIGTYNQSSTGQLFIEIGGDPASGLFDLLTIAGTNNDANLDGDLTVKLISGFNPLVTDVFTILTTSGAVNSVFANAVTTLTTVGGHQFDVNYTGSSVQLGNFVAVPEPASFALLTVGGLLMLRRRR